MQARRFQTLFLVEPSTAPKCAVSSRCAGPWHTLLNPKGMPQVAGGAEESVMTPVWAHDGALLFISDRTGWWNLYRDAAPGGAAPLCPRTAEFGGPAWAFGARPFQTLPDGRCAGVPAPAAGALHAKKALLTDYLQAAQCSQALLMLGMLSDEGVARPEAHVCAWTLGQARKLYLC
jgi:hypothetical protein